MHWRLTLGQQCLDMLVNPDGDQFMTGPSVDAAEKGADVKYSIHITEPFAKETTRLTRGGVPITDFCTPEYYTDRVKRPDIKYSAYETIAVPHEIANDGSLTWRDERKKSVFQLVTSGGELKVKFLSTFVSPKQIIVVSDAEQPAWTLIVTKNVTNNTQLKQLAKGKGYSLIVVDLSHKGSDGQPSPYASYIRATAGKKTPQFFVVDEDGKTITSGDVPSNPADFFKLLGLTPEEKKSAAPRTRHLAGASLWKNRSSCSTGSTPRVAPI